MIFNEIKCRVNTSLGLVGGMHPLHPPCVFAPAATAICGANISIQLISSSITSRSGL